MHTRTRLKLRTDKHHLRQKEEQDGVKDQYHEMSSVRSYHLEKAKYLIFKRRYLIFVDFEELRAVAIQSTSRNRYSEYWR